MTNGPTIRKAGGIWVARAGGAVIAESANAIELTESDMPPVIYFPKEDIAMAFVTRSDTQPSGTGPASATYFSIVAKSGTLENAAWSHETTDDGTARLKDHIAFSTDLVTVEKL